MSDIFLEQLQIPSPKYNLHSGAGSHAQQTAKIITRSEDALIRDNPDLVIVEGDTTTAFASSLAASKLKVPIAHIEAGCRSFDKTLPEEINRVVISHVANLHFPPTPNCARNLMREGVDKKVINLAGHPIVDAIDLVRKKLKEITLLGKTKINPHEYYFVTLHRDFNVDDPSRLEYILRELDKVSNVRTVVFAIHPRTRKRIHEFGLTRFLGNIIKLKPVDYITSLSLIRYAYAIISDSGGLTKESCILGVPSVTLRPNTEWIETIGGYSNQLAFSKGNTLMTCVNRLEKNYELAKKNLKLSQDIFGAVGVSSKIADQIMTSILSN